MSGAEVPETDSTQAGQPGPPTEAPVGFIGLGVMGEAMCRNLVNRSGRSVVIYDRSPAPVARLVDDGAIAAGSVAEVVAASSIVHLSLPGAPELTEVVSGEGGILATLASGGGSGGDDANDRFMIVDHTTAPYLRTTELAQAASKLGVAYCDAPVARTRQAAIDATLAIMVGGEPADVARIRPSLECMATDVTHCGPVGAGQVVKLLNNMILVQNVNALAEAHAIVQGVGLDPAVVFETLTTGSADSFALRNHGKAILADEFPTEAFPVSYALKDIQYALGLALDAEVDAKGGQLARDRLETAIEAGWVDEYWPVLRRIVD